MRGEGTRLGLGSGGPCSPRGGSRADADGAQGTERARPDQAQSGQGRGARTGAQTGSGGGFGAVALSRTRDGPRTGRRAGGRGPPCQEPPGVREPDRPQPRARREPAARGRPRAHRALHPAGLIVLPPRRTPVTTSGTRTSGPGRRRAATCRGSSSSGPRKQVRPRRGGSQAALETRAGVPGTLPRALGDAHVRPPPPRAAPLDRPRPACDLDVRPTP